MEMSCPGEHSARRIVSSEVPSRKIEPKLSQVGRTESRETYAKRPENFLKACGGDSPRESTQPRGRRETGAVAVKRVALIVALAERLKIEARGKVGGESCATGRNTDWPANRERAGIFERTSESERERGGGEGEMERGGG